MAHLRVAVAEWTVSLTADKEGQEIIRKAQEEYMPLLRGQPGFLSYEAIVPDERVSVSVFRWESAADADAGMLRGAAWLQEHLAPWMASRYVYAGDTVASS